MAKPQTPKPQAAKSPKFVQVHYSELAGKTLAYAVAEVLGAVEDNYIFNDDGTISNLGEFAPQEDWAQAGEFFAEYSPAFQIHQIGGKRSFYAILASSAVAQVVGAHGPDHKVALLRAIVLSKLEAEDRGQIAVPEQYLPSQVEALAAEKADAQGQLKFDTGPQDIAPAPSQEERDAHRAAKAQETAQEAKTAPVNPAPAAKPADKPQDKPAAPAKAQDKPSGKPLPQGKHAQALAQHASKPEGK